MKDIISKINESWEYTDNLQSREGVEINVPEKAKWLLINTEGEMITAVTEKELDSMGEDVESLSDKYKKELDSFKDDFDDDETAQAVKKLKIGESYDADGGINIYVRIKK